ncbi:uncharacterized protein LOC119612766 [Lucilia sericata]|uniref:uncharacterized protein LOC119611384 n=1 Tax=Lucilia sericata TaxID=13632 RepID=UPI0018A8352E|nr:uncharacterized protein LOC119611384 [Lucilia sericata]XP_037824554.1 uncharacterized protein LOC119612766 [Lucilia sericata]
MELDDCIEFDGTTSELVYCSLSQEPQTPVPKKKKKPSVTSSWTYSSINGLIQAVEEHPCVWEYSIPDYKDRNKREQAWRDIKENCPGHTVEDCKAKWANVKTAFQNVKKKNKAKSGQGAENIQPHWPHWTAMQFYNQHYTSKSSSSVSTLDVEETQPGCSMSQNVSLPETANSSLPDTANIKKTDMLQRAIKCLEAEEDNWYTIGMYLASQMREIAKKNKKAANKLHLQLVKTVMEATLEAEDEI